MCVGINEATQEANEDSADSKNSRRPANLSKLMTEVRVASDLLRRTERGEEQANPVKSTAQELQDEVNEPAEEDKKSNGSRPPAESWP